MKLVPTPINEADLQPEIQLEIDIDSQFSSRNSNTMRNNESNATEGAVIEAKEKRNVYIDFNTINDVSIDTDE